MPFTCWEIQDQCVSGTVTKVSSTGSSVAFLTARWLDQQVFHDQNIIGVPVACYRVISQFNDDLQCFASTPIFVSPGAISYPDCQHCIPLKVSLCTDPAIFKILPSFVGPVDYTVLVGKVIIVSISGLGESVCCTVSYLLGTINAFWPVTFPTITTGTCVECAGTGCIDIVSNITGVDDVCNRKQGSVTVVPTNGTGPYTFQWSNGAFSTGSTGSIYALSAGPYSVIITDSEGCQGTNSIVLNNLPCDIFYLVTFCDESVQPLNLKNPVISPLPGSNYLCPNIYHGSIVLASSETPLTGCFCLEQSLSGITGATIEIDSPGYPDCFNCDPPTYRITRCDDLQIYYLVNNDLSLLVGKVIRNVTISGCTPPTTFPCLTTPEECWSVTEEEDHAISPVSLDSYEDVFPDCPCCKPC